MYIILQMMCQYSGVITHNMLPPHIFAISDAAFSSLCADSCSQCCVVSGESGAGKDFSVRCYYMSTIICKHDIYYHVANELPAQHLRPSGLFSCRLHSRELSPGFYPGPIHQCRLFQTFA